MDKLYISVYCEDCFRGISIGEEFKGVIDTIKKNTTDVIDQIFTDYDKYRDYEAEISYYAKDASMGTKKISNIDELIIYFNYMPNVVNIIKKYFSI